MKVGSFLSPDFLKDLDDEESLLMFVDRNSTGPTMGFPFLYIANLSIVIL